MQDKLLRPEEAAKYLGIEESDFYRLVKEYKIPYYKIADKFIRFSLLEIDKYKDKAHSLSQTRKHSFEMKWDQSQKPNYTRREKIWEFIRFNDFYLLSSLLIILLLLYIIFD